MVLDPPSVWLPSWYNKLEKNDADAKLVMNTFPQSALVTTYSDNTLITDSAAGGTALACGYKTTNGYLGKLPNGTDIKSIAEAAHENGYSVGIVTSTRLTHATPASFSAHNPDRNAANAIAVDQSDSGFEFFAGGGYRHFVAKDNAQGLKSKRKDDKDVVKMFADRGYKLSLVTPPAMLSVLTSPRKVKKFSLLLPTATFPTRLSAVTAS